MLLCLLFTSVVKPLYEEIANWVVTKVFNDAFAWDLLMNCAR